MDSVALSALSPASRRSVLVWLVLGWVAALPVAADELGSARLDIAGTRLTVSPEAQTVPFETPTLVATHLDGYDLTQGALPPDLRVVGDLVGPEIDGVLRLETVPGEPFRIPRLRLEGSYALQNIRLEQGGEQSGEILAFAEPRDVSIGVTQILVTKVSSRPLTEDEIRNYGLVINPDSYQALNLTFGFGTAGGELVEYNVPVVYDLYGPGGTWGSPLENVGLPRFSGSTTSQRFRPPKMVPFKVELEKETLEQVQVPTGGCPLEQGTCRKSSPPAPPMVGVILFPTDISLLHQFFSVVLMVQNGAPEGDPLVVRDLSARIEVPGGLRQAGTDPPTPLGVPVPVRVPGPDGELGTSDDLTFLVAQASGEAEFLVEGLEEGTHVVDFEMEGLLEGLPTGPQRITGTAKGAVVVRDPTLSVTITHPDVVRAQEAYSLFLTLTNLGNSPVNGIDFQLRAAGLAGVALAPGQGDTESLGSLLPGDSGVVEFRLVAQKTGRVVASSAKAGSSVNPRFEFDVGVSSGIPLSPESIALPQSAQSLPDDLLREALGLLGLGHSLVTAPSTVASELPRVSRQEVDDRVYRLAQAGRHVSLGESLFEALAVLAVEWTGGRDGAWEWDRLRRTTERGRMLGWTLGELLAVEESSPMTAADRFAAASHFLQPWLVAVDGAALEVESQISGKRVAGHGGGAVRDLPFADLLPLGTAADLALVTVAETGGYRAHVIGTGAATDLVVMRPATSPGGPVRRAAWNNVSMPAGARGWVTFDDDSASLDLQIDDDGDGQADRVLASSAQSLPPRPFEVLAAVQNADVDPSGHVVDVLFSSDLDLRSLTPRDPSRFSLPGKVSNGGITPMEADVGGGVLGQPQVDNPLAGMFNPRVVRVVFDNPLSPYVGHDLAVADVASVAGTLLGQQVVAVQTTVDQPGARVEGQVIDPYGQPLPFAEVALYEADQSGIGNLAECVRHRTAAVRADSEGRFAFDYVRQTACSDVFTLEARAVSGPYHGKAQGRVRLAGGTQELDIVMLGRGVVRGQVSYDDGSVPSGLKVMAYNPVFGEGRRAWVDDQGFFRMAEVVVGTVTLLAYDDQGNKVYATIEVPTAGAEVERDMVMIRRPDAATGSVRGRVTSLDTGEPEEGAYVALYVNGSRAGVTRTDAAGDFDFGVVPAGAGEVEAFDGVTGRRGAQFFFEIDPDEAEVVELQLRDDRGTVEGYVRRIREDGSVEPVVGAVVWVEGLPFNTTTDAAGFYRLEDVLTGVRRLNAADVPRGEATHVSASIQNGVVQHADLYFEDDFVPAGGLLGTVLGEDGQPVAGARVHLADGYWSTRWHHEVYTDSEGNFRIEDLEPGVYGVHAIQGAKGGIGFGEVRFAGDSDHVTVRFKSGVIRGRAFVTQAGGEVGVRSTVVYRHVEVVPEWDLVSVVPDYRTLITEDDGSFEIPALFGPYEIYVHNAFHGSKRRSGSLDEITPELDFEFLPNGAIHGVVLGDDGVTPVSGVEVTLRGGAFSDYSLTSDADGAFSFELVPPGRYSITAVSNEGVTFRKQRIYAHLKGHGTEMDVELVLPKQGTVLGWVEDADGQPVPGAVVTLKERGYPWRKLTHNADDEGIFVFDNIFEGDVTLSARAPFLGNLGGKTCVEIVEEGQEVWGVVQLEGTGEVTGVVTNPETGEPVANARVKILTSDLSQSFVDATNTDGDGVFQFSELKLRDYRIHVFDPTTGRHGKSGWAEVESHGQVVTADVVLEARGVVDGHLYNPPSNQTVPGRTVRLWSRGLKWFNTYASTDVDGYFEFEGIPEGDFSLYAGVDGRRARGDGEIQDEDQRVTVDLYLERLAGLTGRVLGPRRPDGSVGDLVENVNVYVKSGGGSRVIAATTDNPFELGDILPRRSYQLWARELNGLHRVSENFLLREGEVREFELVMRAVGSVRVEVETASGTPVPGADVRVTNWYSYANHRPTDYIGNVYKNHYGNTGGDHEVTFLDLRQGKLRAKAEDPITGLKGSKWGLLEWDREEVVLTVKLQASGTVRGQVFLSDGVTPAAGAIVALDAASRDWQLVAADEEGRFEFDAVPLGDYILVAQEELGLGEFEARGELTADLQVDEHVLVLDDADPRVIGIEPSFGTRDLPLSTVVTVRFDEPLRRCTNCGGWFKLKNLATGASVGLSVAWADGDATVVLTPSSLASGTAYKLTITDAVEDLARRNLDDRVVSSFYTADVIAPAVIGVDPRAGTVQVPTESSIEVTFSEPVELESLSGAFQLVELGTGTSKTLTVQPSLDGRRAVLVPVGGMEPERRMELRVSGVRDGSGNVMSGAFVSDFWTVDTVGPAVTWLTPSAGQIFTSGNTVPMAADVTDGRGVAEVTFVMGEWSSVVVGPPYTWDVPAPVAVGGESVAIKVIATDIHGNVSEATRAIHVEPLVNATSPVLALQCPVPGDVVARGVENQVRFHVSDDQAVESYRLLVDGDEVDSRSPVNLSATEAVLAWTPPASSVPGQVFAIRLEVRDFAGNVTAQDLSWTASDGEVLSGSGSVTSGSDTLFLIGGSFEVSSDLSRPAVVLLDGADLEVDRAGWVLDLSTDLRLQCGSSAKLGRVEAGRDIVVETGAVLTSRSVETLALEASVVRLEAGAGIDLTGKGHPGGFSSGQAPAGVTPSFRAGGSHGGRGNVRSGSGTPSDVFGSVYRPSSAGGGGGAWDGNSIRARGGPGGGVLRIEATTVQLDGDVSVRGGMADTSYYSASGAGGTVSISADILSGTGRIDASGEDRLSYACRHSFGAGGGGRVALLVGDLGGFDPESQVSVAAGAAICGTEAEYAAPGTVYRFDASSTYGVLRIDAGVAADGSDRDGASTELPTLGRGAVAGLEVVGTDLWLTAQNGALPSRWLGAWVRLIDSAGAVLGTHRVAQFDSGRALLEGAAQHTGATTFVGVYRFDAVELVHGADLIHQDPVEEADLTLGGDVILAGEFRGKNLWVPSGSTVRPSDSGALVLEFSGRASIESGAVLDVSGRGHVGGWPTGGAPAGIPGSYRSGGSHGGRGNVRSGGGTPSETFGSVYRPRAAGGGGGAYDGNTITARGGPGGGVLVLTAAEIVLDGALKARGGMADTSYYSASGAGGTVQLEADRLSGTGSIDVSGESRQSNNCRHAFGAGGGGRVALHVGDLTGFDIATQVQAAAGAATCGTEDQFAAPGTLYVRTADALYGDLRIDPGVTPEGLSRQGEPTELPVLGSGSILALEVEGQNAWLNGAAVYGDGRWLGAWVQLQQPTGTTVGEYEVLDVDAGGRLLLAGAAGAVASSFAGVYRFDDVSLANGADLVGADPLDVAELVLEGEVELGGPVRGADVRILAGSVVRPVTGGDLSFELSGTLVVEAGARLDVSGRGYAGGWPTGRAPAGIPGSYRAGGSHGGLGNVRSGGGTPSEVFGSVYAPSFAGGGGGAWDGNSISALGGPGGGRIIITATDVVLDGEVRARGGMADTSYYSSSGAAGTVSITAGRLSGAGRIDVTGEDRPSTNCGHAFGGGGGGRVALYVDDLTAFDVGSQVDAQGGSARCGADDDYAGPGTVFTFEAGSVHGDLWLVHRGTAGAPVEATPLPMLGAGNLGVVEIDVADPAHAWVEPADPAAQLSVGVTGMWMRVGGADYRVLAEAPGRRRVLLEGAAGTVAVGDAYRGVYKFDAVHVDGGGHLELLDFDDVGAWHVAPGSQLSRLDQSAPVIGAVTPADGASVTSGDLLGIAAAVTDDRGVTSVTFTFDGLQRVDDAAPFDWDLRAPRVAVASDLVLRVDAVDDEGNASSVEHTITVTPSPDVQAPWIALDPCPRTGEWVEPGVPQPIALAAGDDQLLERLVLEVDGAEVAAVERVDLAQTGHVFSWTVPVGAAPGQGYALTVRAVDYGGGEATAVLSLQVPTLPIRGPGSIDTAVDGQDLVLGAGTHSAIAALQPASVTLLREAVLTAPALVNLSVATAGDLTVQCGAAVDLDARGYPGTVGSGGGTVPGGVDGAADNAGGSHGGQGWTGDQSGQPGEVFDSVYVPSVAGGGGAGHVSGNPGGAGGGVIVFQADHVVLDGEVTARGETADAAADYARFYRSGAGAGGTVRVTAASLSGFGRVDVSGGDHQRHGNAGTGHGGQGGGGRVALYVDDLSAFDPAAQVRAVGGAKLRLDGTITSEAGAGTVLVFDSGATYGDLIVDQRSVGGYGIGATPLPAIGTGSIGAVTAEAASPADAWIEPADPATTFDVGVVGAWLRVGGVDYRILDQSADRRQLLLEDATAAVQVGEAYEGVYKFDSLTVAGSAVLDVVDTVHDGGSALVVQTPVPTGDLVEGGTVDLAVTFTYSDLVRTHTATVDWGDGAGPQPVALTGADGAGSLAASHVYVQDGSYTIEVCVTDDFGLTACAAGVASVANVAPALAALGPVDLRDWTVEEYQRGSQGPADWNVDADGLGVTQDDNSQPTIFYGPVVPYSKRLTGELRMNTDNDWVGFVFGFEPGDTTSAAADFLHLSWKRTAENGSVKGLKLFRITGEPSSLFDQLTATNTTLVAEGATLGNSGWQEDHTYDLAFELDGERFRVWVDGSLEIDVRDPDFGAGQLGFYNYAQSHSRYTGWQVEGFVGEEGRSVDLVRPFADAGAPDLHTVTATWGDGATTAGTVVADGPSRWAAAEHPYTDDGDYLARLCVADGDGGSACLDLPVWVDNVAPEVTASSAPAWSDGESVPVELATYADPGTVDVHTATVDWGDGAAIESVSVETTGPGAGRIVAGHAYVLPGDYTLTICVADDDGGEGCAPLPITVAASADLVVGDVLPGAVTEGEEITFAAAFSNVDAVRVHTATFDWGSGPESATVTESGGAGTASVVRTVPDDASPTAQVCVTDDLGTQACRQTTVTVANVAPSVDGPGAIDFGRWSVEHYALGSFGDSSWSVTEAGSRVAQTANARPAVFLGSESPYSTRITGDLVMDRDDDYVGFVLGFEPGDATDANADYLLLAWKGSDQTYNGEFAARGLRLYRVTGPPSRIWELIGASGVELLAAGNQLGGSDWVDDHVYRFTFELTATRLRVWVDDALEFDVAAVDLGVGRLGFYAYAQENPVFRDWQLETWFAEEGQPVEVILGFDDPGTDAHTADLTWGDGATSTGTVWTADGRGWVGDGHAYGDDGIYTAQICVTDDDGGATCVDLPVRVDNVAPEVTAVAAPTGWFAGAASASTLASYVDPGTLDTHTATVDWGDGQSEPVAVSSTGPGTGQVEGGHAYAAAGTYTVEVCVTDDAGDAGCAQLTVDVAP